MLNHHRPLHRVRLELERSTDTSDRRPLDPMLPHTGSECSFERRSRCCGREHQNLLQVVVGLPIVYWTVNHRACSLLMYVLKCLLSHHCSDHSALAYVMKIQAPIGCVEHYRKRCWLCRILWRIRGKVVTAEVCKIGEERNLCNVGVLESGQHVESPMSEGELSAMRGLSYRFPKLTTGRSAHKHHSRRLQKC